MNVYTHTVLGDLATAVESLPPIESEQPEEVVLAATGTNGAPGDGARLCEEDRFGG